MYKKEKNIVGIYKITNNINGKIYIGQSICIYKRWAEHKRNINIDTEESILYFAFRKYGLENFTFDIIEQCSKEILDEREIYYINKFRSYVGFVDCNGYNMTLGGNSGKGFSPSEKTREIWRKNRASGGNGRAIPVICDGIEYPTIRDCALFYGVEKTLMQNWLSLKIGMPQEFVDKRLRYKDRDFQYKERYGKSKAKPHKIECEGKIYNSITDCAKFYNVPYNKMLRFFTNSMPIEWYNKGLRLYGDDNFIPKIRENQHIYKEKVVFEGEEYKSKAHLNQFLNLKKGTVAYCVRSSRFHKSLLNKELIINGVLIDTSVPFTR